jgi:hypothetical protein
VEQQTDEQREQMHKFGIVQSQKTQYTYKGYVYDRLSDALAYAQIDMERGALPRAN